MHLAFSTRKIPNLVNVVVLLISARYVYIYTKDMSDVSMVVQLLKRQIYLNFLESYTLNKLLI